MTNMVNFANVELQSANMNTKSEFGSNTIARLTPAPGTLSIP